MLELYYINYSCQKKIPLTIVCEENYQYKYTVLDYDLDIYEREEICQNYDFILCENVIVKLIKIIINVKIFPQKRNSC